MIGYDGKKKPSAGKGHKPRYSNIKSFKDNYDQINWGKPKRPKQRRDRPKSDKR